MFFRVILDEHIAELKIIRVPVQRGAPSFLEGMDLFNLLTGS